ncbi:MAG TPA: DUF4242 domain-containing protein [Rhodanobacteraceae bacterium]|jgi:hypothetical protein|nr:DUF4242 domain-containing protein [Rhodanobacteraceae bacterium]
MKLKNILLALLLSVPALGFAGPGNQGTQAQPTNAASHRYIIKRTFPAGALDGLDASTKAKINANNAKFGVKWLMSYANADKTLTYCIYEGPSKLAIREAAKANAIPVDSITEVPVTLTP